jgi:16S rRNA (adenine1518-N6/adenine1519-N6)-dimethyltransferase
MPISPKRLLLANNLHAKRWLGQHFLTDRQTAEKIVILSNVGPEDIVLEIGPGLGALTLPMAGTAKKIYTVEKDREIIPLLESELASDHITNVEVMEKNILDVNLQELFRHEVKKIVVIGNLPYNISSQVLIQLIHARGIVSRAVLMFQKELAARITAQPGSKSYSRITVALRYCADVRSLMRLKASQFYPKPKIDSEILEIRFNPAIENPAHDESVFFSVIKAAFSKRRKTLRNSLAGTGLFKDTDSAKSILEHVGIDPMRRAETLSVDEFVALSNAVSSKEVENA